MKVSYAVLKTLLFFSYAEYAVTVPIVVLEVKVELLAKT